MPSRQPPSSAGPTGRISASSGVPPAPEASPRLVPADGAGAAAYWAGDGAQGREGEEESQAAGAAPEGTGNGPISAFKVKAAVHRSMERQGLGNEIVFFFNKCTLWTYFVSHDDAFQHLLVFI